MIFLPTELKPPKQVAMEKAGIAFYLYVVSLAAMCCSPRVPGEEACIAAPVVFLGAIGWYLKRFEKLEKRSSEEVAKILRP